MRIPCLQCGSKIPDDFKAQFKHMARKHPDLMFQKIIPLICNPDLSRQWGRRLAESLRGRI